MSQLPRVLLLDDQRSVLGVLNEVLRGDFDVVTSTDGDDALRKLRLDGPFHVVMSDMQMPGMDGIEFLRTASEVDPWSVKILLTGHADLTTAMAAVNEGQIFRFLTKPCPPPKLLQAFKDANDRFARRDQHRRNVIGDKERISRRMVQTQGYALLGRLVHSLAGQLQEAGRRHEVALDDAITTAGSGGFVAVEELQHLRDLERVVRGLVERVPDWTAASREAMPAHVKDVVARALDRVRFLGTDQVTVELAENDVPAVLVVSELLEQAFINLFENAFEALDGVSDARLTVELTFDPARQLVCCAIADNGPGVHPEVLPFILRPFFTTNGLNRAGLGLPVAQSAIESFGGKLSLDLGAPGTRFLVELPALEVDDVAH